MKKRVTIRKKTAWAFATTALLIALITAVLTGVGLRVAQKREADKNRLKLDALSKMLTNEKRIKAAAVRSFDDHIASRLRFMTDSLGALYDRGSYTGP